VVAVAACQLGQRLQVLVGEQLRVRASAVDGFKDRAGWVDGFQFDPVDPDAPLPGGLVQDPAQFGVDLLAGGERASRSTPPITLRSVVTVSWVSRPKMTSATPLSTKAASAFRPGPRKCRHTAGRRGGSLVSMSFTSTNTNSNCALFTLPVGSGARVPAAKGRLSKSGNGTVQGRSAVSRGGTP
jgi:hypothetical protein